MSGKREYNEAHTNEVEASRCRKCGSTDRSKYENCRTQYISGIHNGQPFNQMRWKRTRCENCGQVRDDVFREYVQKPEPEPVEVEEPSIEYAEDSPSVTVSKRKQKKQKRKQKREKDYQYSLNRPLDKDTFRDPTPVINRMELEARMSDGPDIVGDAF